MAQQQKQQQNAENSGNWLLTAPVPAAMGPQRRQDVLDVTSARSHSSGSSSNQSSMLSDSDPPDTTGMEQWKMPGDDENCPVPWNVTLRPGQPVEAAGLAYKIPTPHLATSSSGLASHAGASSPGTGADGANAQHSPRSTTSSTATTATEGENTLSLEHIDFQPEEGQPKDAKPPFSYVAMIAMAILQSPQKRLSLKEIYAYVGERFPYYGQAKNKGKWQNSIRHNLSLNNCFFQDSVSDPRQRYWMVDPSCEKMFENGNFKRRKRMKRVKQTVDRSRYVAEARRQDFEMAGLSLGMQGDVPTFSTATNINYAMPPHATAHVLGEMPALLNVPSGANPCMATPLAAAAAAGITGAPMLPGMAHNNGMADAAASAAAETTLTVPFHSQSALLDVPTSNGIYASFNGRHQLPMMGIAQPMQTRSVLALRGNGVASVTSVLPSRGLLYSVSSSSSSSPELTHARGALQLPAPVPVPNIYTPPMYDTTGLLPAGLPSVPAAAAAAAAAACSGMGDVPVVSGNHSNGVSNSLGNGYYLGQHGMLSVPGLTAAGFGLPEFTAAHPTGVGGATPAAAAPAVHNAAASIGVATASSDSHVPPPLVVGNGGGMEDLLAAVVSCPVSQDSTAVTATTAGSSAVQSSTSSANTQQPPAWNPSLG
eukprot:scpid29274/ scgid28548/ Forkhead box protein I2